MSDKNAAPKKTGEDLMRELAADYHANKSGLKRDRKTIEKLQAGVKIRIEEVARSKEVIKQELFDQCKKAGEEIKLIVYLRDGVHVLMVFEKAQTIAGSSLIIDSYRDIKTGYAMYTVEPDP